LAFAGAPSRTVAHHRPNRCTLDRGGPVDQALDKAMSADLQPRHTFHDIPRSLSVAIGPQSVTLTRSTAKDLGPEILLYSEPEHATALIYQVGDLPSHDLWLDGRHRRIPAVPKSTMHILDLGAHGEARFGPTYDSINVHLPRAALKAFAEISGSPKVDGLAEIALRCGFADQSHFTRAFLCHTEATPGKWRRNDRTSPAGRAATAADVEQMTPGDCRVLLS
jgi:AraC-like DNA-binding protein